MSTATDIPPLDGLLVLDLTRWLAGPYCTMLLADAGATVVKVEPPAGEVDRSLEPIVEDADGTPVSAYFLRLNRRKRSVVVDLRTEDGRAAFLDLVARADIVVENFKAGTMDSLGLGEQTLREHNPRLVVCSISVFGSTPSDMRSWPAYNVVAESMAGLVQVDQHTRDPRVLGPAIGDLFPSLHAVAGILMALHRRQLTGRGSFVDIAMFDSCLSLNELAVATHSIAGEEIEYGVRVNPNLAPYGYYPAADGHVCIAVGSETQWLALCTAIDSVELASDTDLRSGVGRATHFDSRIEPVLGAWLRARSRQEAAQVLAGAGVPTSPVWRASETLELPQVLQRGMAETVHSPGGGSWPIPASPIRLSPGFDNGAPVAPVLGADDATYLLADVEKVG